MKRLRIAQVGPMWERIPPPKYGGVEASVSMLTEGLLARGHEVPLFAAGTAKTKAKLVSVYPKPIWRAGIPWSNVTYPYLNFISAFLKREEFDIIHLPLCLYQDYLSLPLPELTKTKTVFTTHSVLPTTKAVDKEKRLLLKRFPHNNFVSISYRQRKGWNSLNWVANIYHGVYIDEYPYNPRKGDYLVWIGKIRPEKGTHEAIKLAKAVNEKLILAGPIDKQNSIWFKYWQEKIKPQVDNKQIVYYGEATRKQVAKLFRNAKAFINPIHWAEAFGYVMAESQCCGTPVITYDRGSAPELVEHKKTGFVVNSFEEMIKAVKDIDQIDRADCHQRVVDLFSIERVIDEHEKLYREILNQA